MIAFDEAQAILAATVTPLAAETVDLEHTTGRVLARDLVAGHASPRQCVSMMDGYAVADVAATLGAELAVTGESRAGRRFRGDLQPGQAVRIFTGAPVPIGADRSIVKENVERNGDQIVIARAHGSARYIRSPGSDFAAGNVLLARGHRLKPRAMVVAAAAGCLARAAHY